MARPRHGTRRSAPGGLSRPNLARSRARVSCPLDCERVAVRIIEPGDLVAAGARGGPPLVGRQLLVVLEAHCSRQTCRRGSEAAPAHPRSGRRARRRRLRTSSAGLQSTVSFASARHSQRTIHASAVAAGNDYCNRRGKRARADALAVLLPLVHPARLHRSGMRSRSRRRQQRKNAGACASGSRSGSVAGRARGVAPARHGQRTGKGRRQQAAGGLAVGDGASPVLLIIVPGVGFRCRGRPGVLAGG